MRNLSPAIVSISLFRRHFASSSKSTVSNINSKHSRRTLHQAKLALTEYFHSTRSLPFFYADHITTNSPHSLSRLVSGLHFSAPNFSTALRKHLLFYPVNEFHFFFESIGIDHDEFTKNGCLMDPNVVFLSESPAVFEISCWLCGFGFPWRELGVLYRGEVGILSKSCGFLKDRFEGLKGLGFSTSATIGICLAFPRILIGDDDLVGDLKRVFVDVGLQRLVEEKVESWYEVCRKIRVFHELGVQIGRVGEVISKYRSVFLQCSEDVLAEKIGFFSRLGVSEVEVGLLVLQWPGVLSIDVETQTVSLLGLLRHFGLEEERVRRIEQEYPYVIGRNKMRHLPRVLRAVGLHEWFFNKIKYGGRHILASYALSSPDEGVDENYVKRLQKIRCKRTHVHELGKLNFLHSVGFAENSFTVKILADTHGPSSELQERFDCLLAAGIEYSKLCRLLSVSPKFINQHTAILREKVNFLCQEIGSSLDYLLVFPAYLQFDLEKRIKPRYKFHSWLEEQGLCARKYSLGTIIATSEQKFIERLCLIHPTAPNLWYEYVACKNEENGIREIAVSQGL